MKFIMWTKEKLRDLVTRVEISRIVGSIVVALSGLFLYLDKVIVFFEINYAGSTFGFSNFETFLWVFTQSAAPLLMILAFPLKPYLSSFFVPIYCYSIQIFWIFQPAVYVDNIYLQSYALGSCAFFLLLVIIIRKIGHWRRQREHIRDQFIEETKEVLEILKSKAMSES